MRPVQITYGRLKSLPGYSNEKLEVTIEVAEGDSASGAVQKAKRFVDKHLGDFQHTIGLKSEEVYEDDDTPF